MRRVVVILGVVLGVVLGAASLTAAADISPAMQKEIDRHVELIKGWAEQAVIVKAVAAQNEKGPLAGMDNPKWKSVRRSDPLVKEFQSAPAGQWLKEKVADGSEIYSEAFLSAARGEKVAFVEKTSSYIHQGQAKFDVPFGSGKPWQGKAEFDESSQTHQLQVSVPVVSGGKPIGVLVVGLNLSKLEKLAKK